MDALSPVIYLPHGGGPLPLLGDPSHLQLAGWLQSLGNQLSQPSAILLVSAHWESNVASLTASDQPPLIYDYGGFPEVAYKIEYPAPGSPELAHSISELLEQKGINAGLDKKRGFDHGLFVPLKLMYPNADIPCVQLSLLRGLDPADHLAIGKALADLRKQNVLVVGSGFSFHNMQAFMSPGSGALEQCKSFNEWLIETVCSPELALRTRKQRLINWSEAPSARFCHPREEHLMPLHVCFGLASAGTDTAELAFHLPVLGYPACGFIWH